MGIHLTVTLNQVAIKPLKTLEITPQEVHEEVKKLHFSEEVELASQQELNGDSSLKTYGPDILL